MDQSSVTSAKQFFGRFLRSFGKALLSYLILLSILIIGPWIIAGSHEFGELLTSECPELLTASIPVFLGMGYCYGWAGAMHRCNVIRVGATGAFGALIIAALSLPILLSIHLTTDDFTLAESLIVPVLIFVSSWLTIAWIYFVLGFWGNG